MFVQLYKIRLVITKYGCLIWVTQTLTKHHFCLGHLRCMLSNDKPANNLTQWLKNWPQFLIFIFSQSSTYCVHVSATEACSVWQIYIQTCTSVSNSWAYLMVGASAYNFFFFIFFKYPKSSYDYTSIHGTFNI